MKSHKSRRVWIGSLVAVSALTLAACGGSTDDTSTSPTVDSSGQFLGPDNTYGAWDSQEAAEEFGVQTWEPVGVTRSLDGAKIQLIPGQVASFVDLASGEGQILRIESDNIQVVAPITGELQDDSGLPSFQGVKQGETTVRAYQQESPDGPESLVMTLDVLVDYSGEKELIPPPECEPKVTNLDETAITLIPTQRAVYPQSVRDGQVFFAESSNEEIVIPWDSELPDANIVGVGYIGLIPGKAEVKIYAGTRENPGELLQTVQVTVVPDDGTSKP
jgi:hypothetical protein